MIWSMPGEPPCGPAEMTAALLFRLRRPCTWNSVYSQTGQTVTVKDAGWNNIVTNGATGSFGFQASYDGSSTTPSNFTLNGVACTVNGGAPGSAAPTPPPDSAPAPPPAPRCTAAYGAVAQYGSSVAVQNADWNGAVAAGASAGFGFQASYTGSNAAPSVLYLNGTACAVQ